MKLVLVLMVLGTVVPTNGHAQSVCPNPNKPCGSFKPYELPFRIQPSTATKAEDQSAEFFAVILKSAKPCSISDDERITAQKLFAGNKVFVSRFECEPEDNIAYTTVDGSKPSILAVYAGNTRREANSFLTRVRKTGRFPDAYMRRMKVVLVHP
jgi:hypothetical protein